MEFHINGALAPVFTPIDENGDINFPIIPKYMQYLHENSIHGILVGGTTGEAVCFNVSERKAILDAWVKVAKPCGIKVIFQVGGVPLPDVIDLAKHATEARVDAIMTLPELYYKPKSVEQLVQYLQTVSEAAPALPLIYYHFPMMTGVDVNITRFFTLATSIIPNFKGMKADLQVAIQLTDYLAGQIIFIANHHIAPSVLMSHDSSIATVTNIFPNLVNGIVESVKRNDLLKARRLQEKLNRLVDVITSNGEFIPSMKAAMEIVTGIEMGPPRQPIRCLGKEERKKIEEDLINII